MGDHLGESGPIKQRGGKNVHRVKPTTGLPDVLNDEIGRVVRIEPILVLEGVVHLGEGHRTGVEPHVQHVGNTTHHRLPCGVIGVRADEFINSWTVEIRWSNPEVPLKLVQRAIDIQSRIVRVVALPHRNG